MTKSFNEYFKETILKNKRLIIAVIIVTVLGFGFTITNFSIGVDDPAVYHYLHSNSSGNMIQQGRILHVLIDKLTGGRLTFIPFLNDFIGAALFGFSSLVFCGLFQYVTDGKLNDIELMAFAGIYISYSIISEKFIYNLDVIVTMLSYVCVAYSLALVCEFFNGGGGKQIKPLLLSCLVLTVGLGSYESFVFVYVCGVFAIFVIECIVGEKKLTFKDVLFRGLMFLLILIAAMIIYYLTVFLVQALTGQLGRFYRTTALQKNGIIYGLIEIARTIRRAISVSSYLPMQEFFVFSIIGFVLTIVYSIKRKSFVLTLCCLALFISNFGIHMVTGNFFYRASQTLCLFIAFALLLLAFSLRKLKLGKTLLPALVGLLIFVQLADLNLSFYHDYSRYKKDEFVINTIATRLVSECNVNKPVVFTSVNTSGEYQVAYLNSRGFGQVNGASAIYWGCQTFKEPTSPIMLNLFRMHGYNFLIEATPEQAERGNKLAENMECWPKQGCIQEFDDIIVVNF